MSDDTRQLLHDAAPLPEPPEDFDVVWSRALRQRRGRLFAAGLGAVGVLAVAVVMLPGALGGQDPGGIEIVGQPDEPAWPEIRGAMWRVPLDTIPHGVTAGVVEDRRVFFVRSDEAVEVLLAAAQHLTNEGLWWCPDEQLFAAPAHGELFHRNGTALFGPADRDLDRLAAVVDGDSLLIDPTAVIAGGRAEVAGSIGDVLAADQSRAYEGPWDGAFCGGHQPDDDPPTALAAGQPPGPAPDHAVPVDRDDVPQHLWEGFVPEGPVVMIAVDPTGQSDRKVLATPESDPSLLFGTSCDLVSAVPLPPGWLGYCLEITHDGDRISSLFPWGTTSTTAAEAVHVPSVQGLLLADAQQILRNLGLQGEAVTGTHDGQAWQDPDDPGAVVVNQAPPAGTLVRPGEVVGFRTAVIAPKLCVVLTDLPPRQGDALALAATDAYWDMLERARPHAAPPLAGYIDELLDHHRAGQPTQDAPTRPLDSVAIHHDACHAD